MTDENTHASRIAQQLALADGDENDADDEEGGGSA